jgi:hypothetical protein
MLAAQAYPPEREKSRFCQRSGEQTSVSGSVCASVSATVSRSRSRRWSPRPGGGAVFACRLTVSARFPPPAPPFLIAIALCHIFPNLLQSPPHCSSKSSSQCVVPLAGQTPQRPRLSLCRPIRNDFAKHDVDKST